MGGGGVDGMTGECEVLGGGEVDGMTGECEVGGRWME